MCSAFPHQIRIHLHLRYSQISFRDHVQLIKVVSTHSDPCETQCHVIDGKLAKELSLDASITEAAVLSLLILCVLIE